LSAAQTQQQIVAAIPMHGYAMSQPVSGSPHPVYLSFAWTRDEIYVPLAVRKPPGAGPFPAIIMGRGNGRGGMPHVIREVERCASMQDTMIERGYVVAFVNYRNEVPHLYNEIEAARSVADDMTAEGRVRLSSPALDSNDLGAVIRYLQTLPYVRAGAIGAMGVSHGGEMIMKCAAEMSFGAGVVIEGASHEFLVVDTGPSVPRRNGEIQYNDIEAVRANADKKRAMERIARINTPMLHLGRDQDHLQGIFKLVHEWMLEAGKDSTWASFDHPDHGYPFIYRGANGAYRPDPIQVEAFAVIMDFFDRRIGRPVAPAR
jgi:dienelactone hydrolase